MGANKEYMEALGIDWKTYSPKPHEKWELPSKEQTAPETRNKVEEQESPKIDTKPKRQYKKYLLWVAYFFLFWFAYWLVTAKVDDDPIKQVNESVIDPIKANIMEKFEIINTNMQSVIDSVNRNAKKIYLINKRLTTLEGRVLDVDPETYANIVKFYNTPIQEGYQRTLTLKGCLPVQKTLPLRRKH